MELDDELENFIRERKARVVQDKASLEQDPPYLEIKRKHTVMLQRCNNSLSPRFGLMVWFSVEKCQSHDQF
uniref:Uncharacterized protein n=1 Tax=Oryzias melastigma TaxID=30732 RepID=A0A3B3CIY1_ORYME